MGVLNTVKAGGGGGTTTSAAPEVGKFGVYAYSNSYPSLVAGGKSTMSLVTNPPSGYKRYWVALVVTADSPVKAGLYSFTTTTKYSYGEYEIPIFSGVTPFTVQLSEFLGEVIDIGTGLTNVRIVNEDTVTATNLRFKFIFKDVKI